jgi:hypothetical protein
MRRRADHRFFLGSSQALLNNHVLKLSDGSYAVHKIKISWPHHVFVSKNFKVTGAIG